jgi:hypothetical protein
MRLLASLLVVSLGVVSACATTTVKHETIRFVNEAEAVRLQPVVTILTAPTQADDELTLRLTRKVHGPLYEVDVTEEQARAVDVRRIAVIALATVSGGIINFTTTEGKTIVRSLPRKIKDVEEVEEAWPSARATLDIDGVGQSQLASDRDGRISVRIAPLLRLLNRRPAGALRMTLSASNGVETDTKVVELAADIFQGWLDQGPR